MKKTFVGIIIVCVMIIGFVLFLDNYTKLLRLHIQLHNHFEETKKISEMACYKRTGGPLGLGYISHDYTYKKVMNCKKIEYRGMKNGNYYTYFIVDRGIKSKVLANFSDQETYFSEVEDVIRKLEISNNVKDMYISGDLDYSIEGNEFDPDMYGSRVVIYVNQNLRNILEESVFKNYKQVSKDIENLDKGADIYIQYEDGYKVALRFSNVELYKEDEALLDSDGKYEIETYSDLLERLG